MFGYSKVLVQIRFRLCRFGFGLDLRLCFFFFSRPSSYRVYGRGQEMMTTKRAIMMSSVTWNVQDKRMLVNVGGMEMTMVKREPGKKKNRMVRSSLIRDQYHWSGAAITTKGQFLTRGHIPGPGELTPTCSVVHWRAWTGTCYSSESWTQACY